MSSSLTPLSVPALPTQQAGVFTADPLNPPPPPPGAEARVIKDETGTIVCYCWVLGEHAGDAYEERLWTWLEEKAPDIGPATDRRHLRLA